MRLLIVDSLSPPQVFEVRMLADPEDLSFLFRVSAKGKETRLVWGNPRNLTALISHALAQTYLGTQHTGDLGY